MPKFAQPGEGPREWTPRTVPLYLVISAQDDDVLTPDDLVIEPAFTKEDVDKLWDWHDGRTMGSMVVAVYKFDLAGNHYVRDQTYGMFGDVRKTGPADPEKDTFTSL